MSGPDFRNLASRSVLRAIKMLARGGRNGWSDSLRRRLAGLTREEVDRITSYGIHDVIQIDEKSLIKALESDHNDVSQRALKQELFLAGATNDLMREIFGLSMGEIRRQRTLLGCPTPRSPRQLTAEEISLVAHSGPFPVGVLPSRKRVLWCLDVHQTTGIPLMSIYRWTQNVRHRS